MRVKNAFAPWAVKLKPRFGSTDTGCGFDGTFSRDGPVLRQRRRAARERQGGSLPRQLERMTPTTRAESWPDLHHKRHLNQAAQTTRAKSCSRVRVQAPSEASDVGAGTHRNTHPVIPRHLLQLASVVHTLSSACRSCPCTVTPCAPSGVHQIDILGLTFSRKGPVVMEPSRETATSSRTCSDAGRQNVA